MTNRNEKQKINSACYDLFEEVRVLEYDIKILNSKIGSLNPEKDSSEIESLKIKLKFKQNELASKIPELEVCKKSNPLKSIQITSKANAPIFGPSMPSVPTKPPPPPVCTQANRNNLKGWNIPRFDSNYKGWFDYCKTNPHSDCEKYKAMTNANKDNTWAQWCDANQSDPDCAGYAKLAKCGGARKTRRKKRRS